MLEEQRLLDVGVVAAKGEASGLSAGVDSWVGCLRLSWLAFEHGCSQDLPSQMLE